MGKNKEEPLRKKENEEMKNELQKAKSEMQSQKTGLKDKDDEIESLKEQIKGYHIRLESVLANISQNEKEKIHLADSLESLKRTNLLLNAELQKKNTEKAIHEKNYQHKEPLKGQKSICHNDGKECVYWKQKRCQYEHPLDEKKRKSKGKAIPEETDDTKIVDEAPGEKEIEVDDEDKSQENKEMSKRSNEMCMDGKKCKQMDECPHKHTCNFKECRHGENCKYIHIQDKDTCSNENPLSSKEERGEKVIKKTMCMNGKWCKNRNTTCEHRHVCGYLECKFSKQQCRYLHDSEKEKDHKETKSMNNAPETKECSNNNTTHTKLMNELLKDVINVDSDGEKKSNSNMKIKEASHDKNNQPCRDGKNCKNINKECPYRHTCKFGERCNAGREGKCRFIHLLSPEPKQDEKNEKNRTRK